MEEVGAGRVRVGAGGGGPEVDEGRRGVVARPEGAVGAAVDPVDGAGPAGPEAGVALEEGAGEQAAALPLHGQAPRRADLGGGGERGDGRRLAGRVVRDPEQRGQAGVGAVDLVVEHVAADRHLRVVLAVARRLEHADVDARRAGVDELHAGAGVDAVGTELQAGGQRGAVDRHPARAAGAGEGPGAVGGGRGRHRRGVGVVGRADGRRRRRCRPRRRPPRRSRPRRRRSSAGPRSASGCGRRRRCGPRTRCR